MSEAGTAVHPLDKVLMTGEEIEALRITEEKLRKVQLCSCSTKNKFVHLLYSKPFCIQKLLHSKSFALAFISIQKLLLFEIAIYI